MRQAFFGGTFDPIHVGHLDVAEAARAALGVERVTFVPSRTPPHRSAPKASAAHRFAMVALALQDLPSMLVSDIEMRSEAPAYTTDTLARLADAGIGADACVLVIGADAFLDILLWKDSPALLDRCSFVVISRPHLAAPTLIARLPALAARMIVVPAGRVCPVTNLPAIFLVDAPTAPVSSTVLRHRLAGDEPIHDLVPPRVADYITKHGLYT